MESPGTTNGKITLTTILSYFSFLLIGLFAVFHPTILSGFSMIQTDLGDTRINNYLLEHGFQWISGNPVHHNIWSPPFFYPDPNAAAYTDILLGGAPFYWAFRFLGIQFDTSFQLWMIVVLGLNYLTMLFFLRRGLGLSVIASIGGAYLLAFASSRANQLCHQQLLPQFFAIIACLCLARVFGSASNRNPQHPSVRPWIVVFAISITLQLYASFYLGWFLCFGLVVFALLTICFKTTREELWLVLKKNWGVIFVSFAGGSLALAWMALHYLQGPLAARPWPEVATMIPRLESWINLGPFNWSWGWLRRYIDFQTLPMEHEHLIGLGIVTLCVIFMGLKPLRQNQWGKLLVLTSVIIFLGAMMYPHGLSPWQIVYKVMPGSGAIRAVTRIVLLLLIPASILLAMGLDRIQGKTLSFVLLVLICMEQVVTTPAYDKNDARKDAIQIVERISSDCSSFYYAKVLGPGESSCSSMKYQLDAVTAQLVCNKPTLNGHIGLEPPNWIILADPIVRSRFEIAALKRRVYNWTKEYGLDPNSEGIIYDREVTDLPHWVNDTAMSTGEKVDLIFGMSVTRPFLTKGWSGDEKNEKMSWVWANDLESELFVPLQKAASYEMFLNIEPLIIPNLIQDITLSLNGVVVNHFVLHQELQTYKTYLPAALVSEVNLIQFKFKYAITPSSLGGSHDTRRLAALFHKVTFIRGIPFR